MSTDHGVESMRPDNLRRHARKHFFALPERWFDLLGGLEVAGEVYLSAWRAVHAGWRRLSSDHPTEAAVAEVESWSERYMQLSLTAVAEAVAGHDVYQADRDGRQRTAYAGSSGIYVVVPTGGGPMITAFRPRPALGGGVPTTADFAAAAVTRAAAQDPWASRRRAVRRAQRRSSHITEAAPGGVAEE